MKFLVHYIVKGPVKNANFDFVWDGPVSAKDIDDLRGVCASDASQKTTKSERPGRKNQVFPGDIVIAGIFPIPSGEPARTKEIGGS